jgi:hypothetical protein
MSRKGVSSLSSQICCPNGHSTRKISIHQAAISIAEGRAIGACDKCGKQLQYRIEHTYPKGKQSAHVVTRAVRLGTRLADDENYDPFLLVLLDTETDKEQILPTFWAYSRNNAMRGGQFPPLLSFEEWGTLFRQLDASFFELEERIRVRAYELYEQRGKRHGHALDDWLEAEAELTGQEALRPAA